MSLLPAAFRNTDPMPMALGAKIEAPVPKKPDPIADFEVGAHLPNGEVVEPWREYGGVTAHLKGFGDITVHLKGFGAIAPPIDNATATQVAFQSAQHQNAVAAKMAEIQRQKQELRTMVNKRYMKSW